jgi:transcriptional regulator of acetoin/glycerol metabolism
MYEMILAAALGTAAVVTTLALIRSKSALETFTDTNTSHAVHVEQMTQAQPVQPSPTPVAKAMSKGGISDERFRDIYLNANNSINEIAKICGYKSRSTVYRRAKRLGLTTVKRK